jgi:hypothetical protein
MKSSISRVGRLALRYRKENPDEVASSRTRPSL